MALIRSSKLRQSLDWPTVFIYFLMVGLGWLNVYAAVYSPDNVINIFSWDINSGKQLAWIGTSVILIIVVLVIDYKAYDSLAYIIYGAMILLLLATLILANPIKGSRSWLELGAVRLQPAEFAKFATALAVSKFLSSVNLRQQNWQDHAKLVALTLLPPFIILLQNETGSALVFGAFLLAYFREGMSPLILIVGTVAVALFISTLLFPKLYLVIVITVGLGLWLWANQRILMRKWPLILMIYGASIGMIFSVDFFVNNVLQEHQQNRIKALISPEADPRGFGWNVTQSKIAIGSGGFMGKGFLEGTQTKFDFVPEQSTDFIFCTIGEEHGWVGSVIVIGLFVLLLTRIVKIAERQKSVFGRTYGYCVASIIFFHFLVNIGMTIGLAPVVGIPLPFFSYGGSSLWSFTTLLFILLALDANRKQDLTR
ncbi:rod shape-determining protein RodA [Adhaeribacter sp. BT258]|uniref:Cell wall polymerase n=1 Tax=Adhaeribacter terrigena TaxID=2793070 RepID=A0ABS1C562_9BACT|nr:rod shape-determining protein RodA [Adhaeribacter terrigena]MBK0404524.1 rod shape-determining protein RodA [Adhaeribacter terrigena]